MAPSDTDAFVLHERCNSIDDDGDGFIDEGCPIRLTFDRQDDRGLQVANDTIFWNRDGVRDQKFFREIRSLNLAQSLSSLALTTLTGPFASPLFKGDWGSLVALDGHLNSNCQSQIEAAFAPEKVFSLVNHYANRDLVLGGSVRSTKTEIFALPTSTCNKSIIHTTSKAIIGVIPADDWVLFYLADGYDVSYQQFLAAVSISLPAEPRIITTSPVDLGWDIGLHPIVIDHGKILAFQRRGSVCDLLLHDLAKNTTETIESSSATCLDYPSALQQDWAAFSHDPFGSAEVVLLNLKTHQRYQVTKHNRTSRFPQFAGGFVVWEDDRNDNWDLYAMDIRQIDAGDFFPEGLSP